MPIYAFQWTGEKTPTRVELADEDAAWSQAVITTGQMLREGSFPQTGALEVEVCDGTGHPIGWISVKATKAPQ